MARPTKTSRRRGVVRDAVPLKVALSHDERATLAHKATAARMTMADFTRSLIVSATVAMPAENPRRVAFELNKLGVNLNQIAKVAQTYKAASESEVRLRLRQLAAAAEAIVAEHCPAIAERTDWSKAYPK